MVKIPQNAKCVFNGILFDVYQWQQEMFDGTYETFEAIKRQATTQIIVINSKNKIILLNEEQPYVGKFISVPGGRVERGDTPEETVHKELLEELGMRANKVKYWMEASLGSKIEWSSYFYIAQECEIIQEQNLESGERIVPFEVTFEEFLEVTQKNDFRNKELSSVIYKIQNNKKLLEEFKQLLFN